LKRYDQAEPLIEASSAALAKSLGQDRAQTRRALALREEVRQKRAGDSR
jgi:hypothetical protein